MYGWATRRILKMLGISIYLSTYKKVFLQNFYLDSLLLLSVNFIDNLYLLMIICPMIWCLKLHSYGCCYPCKNVILKGKNKKILTNTWIIRKQTFHRLNHKDCQLTLEFKINDFSLLIVSILLLNVLIS